MISKVSTFAEAAAPPQLQEIALAKANFLSSFFEASFHHIAIDAKTYKSQRDAAFQDPELLLSSYPEGLIANAQSLISFSAALADDPSPLETFHGNTRWQALSTAITNLSSASKLPSIDAESTVKTHILRGEASFLLWRLGHPPTNLAIAASHKDQLLKNAEVFYRNASKLSEDEEEKAVARLRSEMAGVMMGEGEEGAQAGHRVLEMMNEKGKEWVRGQIEEMVDEGLVPESVWELFM